LSRQPNGSETFTLPKKKMTIKNDVSAILLVMLTAGCAGPAKQAADSEVDKEIIRATLNKAIDAFNREDLDAYLKLHADDAIVLAPDRPTEMGKEAILVATRELFTNYAVRERRRIEEILVSGNLALVRGSYDSVSAPKRGGAAVRDVGKYVEILVKQGPNWKYKRSIWNSDGQSRRVDSGS
jgi:ketosteroid isomerase-like protein